jgi:hypothetical protein
LTVKLYLFGIVSFVFTPLAVTVALLLCLLRNRIKDIRSTLPTMDTPGLLLAVAARQMPGERREWGAAMMAELSEIHDLASRWRFALSCVRVVLFPPRRAGLLRHALAGRSPVCGMLAIAAPPLGLPFIYFAAVIVQAIGGSPFTQSSSWSSPDAVIVIVRVFVMLAIFCMLAGLPLGLAGLFRRERLRRLSTMGMFSSLCVIGYFLIVMHFVAGGPNGD